MVKNALLYCALAGIAAAQGPIRVGGSQQQTKLVEQTRPVYPPEAKQIGLSGDVLMNAVIDKEGHVASLEVVSGHPLLADAATTAVRNWVYQPTLLNGEPVEVMTQVHVNFTLEGDPAAKGSSDQPKPKLLNKVAPVYPADAKAQGIAGPVKLRVTIGTDGRVQKVRVLEGKPPLVAAAVDAVRQWVFEPVEVNGQTVTVLSDVTLNFELP
jgi:TonB family protein